VPRILLTFGPDDWQKMLADPKKHWRSGYSARARVLLGSFGWITSLTTRGPPAVYGHLSVNHVRHIAALAEELHYLLASTCHLCPPGFRFGVLFQPTNLVPVENEIHLPQGGAWEFCERDIKCLLCQCPDEIQKCPTAKCANRCVIPWVFPGQLKSWLW